MNAVAKRLLDIVLSALALVVFSPLFLTLAVVIKLDSSGPVLFRQKRLSKNGRVFTMLKFRSMVVNAETMGAGLFNYEKDPRVTGIGRFLRSSSLDELPQLINVLKGDMSLVGPRPCVVGELGDFGTLNARYKKRFSVLPGITGYAQVSGRNEISWDQKVNLDNVYIDLFQKQGVWMDLKILLKTIANVFRRRNIYETRAAGFLSDRESAEASERDIVAKAHATENDKTARGAGGME